MYFCEVKELVRHIETLLLKHDCVVIPQIGGFITCNVPARYVEEESLFLPPYRTVGFNKQLKTDDGLLVHSYAEVYKIQETGARKILGEKIRELQQELWENGSYDLGSIGMLTMDEQNEIQFSPCQAGTVCPAYYGLDSLLFPLRMEQPAVRDLSVEPDKQEQTKDEHDITIHVKRSWLNNIAAAAAAIIMFFLFSPQAENTGAFRGELAEFSHLMALQPAVKTTTGTQVETAPVAEETAPLAETPQTEASQTGSAAEQTAAAPDEFCVVLASAITEKNAEIYTEQLQKRGYTGVQVYKSDKMVRVIIAGFSTEAEAYSRLREMRDQSEEFEYAWVYRIK